MNIHSFIILFIVFIAFVHALLVGQISGWLRGFAIGVIGGYILIDVGRMIYRYFSSRHKERQETNESGKTG